LFFVTSLQLIFEDQGQEDTHDAGDQAAQECRTEPGNFEADPKPGADLPGQIEDEGIDQEGEQPQGEENQWTSQEFQNWTDDGVGQPKDECQPQDGPLIGVLGVNAGYDLKSDKQC